MPSDVVISDAVINDDFGFGVCNVLDFFVGFLFEFFVFEALFFELCIDLAVLFFGLVFGLSELFLFFVLFFEFVALFFLFVFFFLAFLGLLFAFGFLAL